MTDVGGPTSWIPSAAAYGYAATMDELFNSSTHALMSGSAGGVSVPQVVQFGGAPGALSVTQAYHGQFWPIATNLGQFSWEFWSCLLDSTILGYLVSEGYGGAHAILATVCPNPTGNIYNGSGNVSFGGGYTAQIGEWVHSRFAWDGTFIYCWINGILVSLTPFAGPRQAQFGTLFIAGSDHSNFTGRIAQVRAYEGQCPMFNSASHQCVFTPERVFSLRMPPDNTGLMGYAQFVAHYMGTATARAIPDMSDGFGGTRHPGVLKGVNGWGLIGNTPGPFWVSDPTAPFSLLAEPARTRIPTPPVSVPTGAKIWDSVGRADSIPAFTPFFIIGTGTAATVAGSTEGGSLGPLLWNVNGTTGPWGVFDNTLVCFDPNFNTSLLSISNNSANMDIRVDRANAVGYSGAEPTVPTVLNNDVALVFRMQDAANYLKLYVIHDSFGTNVAALATVIANVVTVIAQWNLPNYTWTTLRAVLAGTTITGFADGTQIGQQTGVSTFQTQTGVGLLGGGSTAMRYRNFVVF